MLAIPVTSAISIPGVLLMLAMLLVAILGTLEPASAAMQMFFFAVVFETGHPSLLQIWQKRAPVLIVLGFAVLLPLGTAGDGHPSLLRLGLCGRQSDTTSTTVPPLLRMQL